MNKMKNLMTLVKGTSVVFSPENTIALSQEIEYNTPYIFLEYDESNIPKNDLSKTMTWYTSKPIWTPEEYEEIRYKFMMIKLEGVDRPQLLKDFEIYTFTE